MVHSSRLLILGGPSSVPLWTQKYALEEICLAVAVLLLQISQLQHKRQFCQYMLLFAFCVCSGLRMAPRMF